MKDKTQNKRRKELAREEWDFGKCPTEHLELCFGYEYARESDWVVKEFQRHKASNEDEWGIWHFHVAVIQGADMDDDAFLKFLNDVGLAEDYDWDVPPSVDLWLPPGFPKKPFLKCGFDFGEWLSSVEDYWEQELKDYDNDTGLTEVPPDKLARDEEHAYTFQLDWRAPDGQLLSAFRAWLLKKRPELPEQRRGKSRSRQCAADLKALGAYRLLQRFSARAAQEFTAQFVPGGLYTKLPDWYESRRRAHRILTAFFRHDPGPTRTR